jgi:hypothetical protein
VYDCTLRNLYWFDDTLGMNHLKIKKKKTSVTIVFVIHFSYTNPGNILGT